MLRVGMHRKSVSAVFALTLVCGCARKSETHVCSLEAERTITYRRLVTTSWIPSISLGFVLVLVHLANRLPPSSLIGRFLFVPVPSLNPSSSFLF